MLKSMTIGKKIAMGFTLLLVFLCTVGVAGYISTSTATTNISDITAQLDIAKEINTTLTDAQDAQAASLRYIIYDDIRYHKTVEEEIGDALKHTASAKALMRSPENRAKADEAVIHMNGYLAANKEWGDLQAKKHEAGAIRAQAADVVLGNIKDLMDSQVKAIADHVHDTGTGRVTNYEIVERILKAQEARNAINSVYVYAYRYLLAITPETQDEMAGNWVNEIERTRQALIACKEVMRDPAALKALDSCLTALDSYSAQVEVFRQIDHEQHNIQMNKLKPAAGALIAQSCAARDGVYEFVDNVKKQSDERMAFIASLITWVGIGAVALGVLFAVLITRGITKTLTRIITGLNEGADQVNDAAGQVASASQQLAEGASEQASSLEETSSALEQMAAMTRTNAENAKEANSLSGQARDAAQSGDQTMDKLNNAMAAINESSGQISKIIKVIEEIAFQTNLLALNAAVEAARAGEHGKGFAVVADEVRNLAQRAAQAARETTSLIENSVGRAKEGADVAGEVAQSLGAIVGDVTRVTDLINGIARASEEQAEGVEQVNMAVSQMDKVTQQNASGAEESASAAEELSAQAATVKGTVDELAQMIGGRNAKRAAWQTNASTPKAGKRLRSAVGRLKKHHVAVGASTHSHPQSKAQSTPATGASQEFPDLDDDQNLESF